MKVYIVFSEDADLTPYEGDSFTFTDSVWTSLEKARNRIKDMCTDWMKENVHPETCDLCQKCVSGTMCFYNGIDSPTENEIIINIDDYTQKSFYIEEHELDKPCSLDTLQRGAG